MKKGDPVALSAKYKLLRVLLAVVGIVLIFFSTHRYGAVLSSDSVTYLSVARNLIKGTGLISYEGVSLVRYPPLYPAFLALVGKIIGADPLLFAHIVNALLYGLIVYLGGVLIFKTLSSFPAFALAGTMTIGFSIPLFNASVYALSEPLFICFMLLSFISADSYHAKNDVTSLIFFSSSIALSSLTRYCGIALILWGALIISLSCRAGIKRRITHLALFTLVSALPLGLWLIRTYAVSGALFPYTSSRLNFFEYRASFTFLFCQNLTYMFKNLLYWYIPQKIVEHRFMLLIVSAGAGLFTGLCLRDGLQGVKVRLQQISPILLFVIIYTVFLIVSSSINDHIRIDSRLLSPIYVPLNLLLLILAQALVDSCRKRFSGKIIHAFLILSLAIWFVYPVGATVRSAVRLNLIGKGYSGKAWMESETRQYLIHHQILEPECTVYSNGPDAVYILTNRAAKASPSRKNMGHWSPEERSACLVWFDRIERPYLATIDELQLIVNMNLIARFADGAIYSLTKKNASEPSCDLTNGFRLCGSAMFRNVTEPDFLP